MTEGYKAVFEVFDHLRSITICQKTAFLDQLLFTYTIAGRGIWSDESATESEKLAALKWLNELTHRT